MPKATIIAAAAAKTKRQRKGETPRVGRLLTFFVSGVSLVLASGCFATANVTGDNAAFAAAPDGKCLAPEDPEVLADQVLQLVNLERTAAALPPVTRSHKLEKVAVEYACRMVEDGFFDHTDPITGEGPGDRAIAAEYEYFAVGENLAAGQPTAAEVMKVWMDSPAHRDNILDPRWVEIGIGVRSGGEYSIYWVQEFGAPADY
jgi:uncharacterized protein YkwD